MKKLSNRKNDKTNLCQNSHWIHIYSPPILLPCRSLVFWPHCDSASSGEHSRNGARGCEWHAVLPELPRGPHPLHPHHVGPAAPAVWHAGLHLLAVCNHWAYTIFFLHSVRLKMSMLRRQWRYFDLRGRQDLWLLRALETLVPSWLLPVIALRCY